MVVQRTPLQALQEHVASRPRITEEVLTALTSMAKGGSTKNIRELGATMLIYIRKIQDWMIEEDKLVRALPGDADAALVDALLAGVQDAPALSRLEQLLQEELEWRQALIAQLLKLRRSGK